VSEVEYAAGHIPRIANCRLEQIVDVVLEVRRSEDVQHDDGRADAHEELGANAPSLLHVVDGRGGHADELAEAPLAELMLAACFENGGRDSIDGSDMEQKVKG
jgi:hypothetical protein